jgi:hypothetical protein
MIWDLMTLMSSCFVQGVLEDFQSARPGPFRLEGDEKSSAYAIEMPPLQVSSVLPAQ